MPETSSSTGDHVRSGDPVLPSEWLEALEDFAQFDRDHRGITQASIDNKQRILRRFAAHVAESASIPLPIADLSVQHIDDFLIQHVRPRSRTYASTATTAIRTFLRYLGLLGYIEPELASQVPTTKSYTLAGLPRALPEDDVRRLLDAVPRDGVRGHREYAIMVLLAYYGLRVGDIVTLRLDDIHWRQAEILIQQGKTDRPLLLPLVDEVAEALLDYLQLRPRCEHREVFLRLSVYGPPHGLGRARISHMVQDAMTRAGIQWTRGMAAYTLRHSFATHRVRVGLPLKTVGDCLGHATTSTTFIYTKLAVEDLRSVCLDPQELLG